MFLLIGILRNYCEISNISPKTNPSKLTRNTYLHYFWWTFPSTEPATDLPEQYVRVERNKESGRGGAHGKMPHTMWSYSDRQKYFTFVCRSRDGQTSTQISATEAFRPLLDVRSLIWASIAFETPRCPCESVGRDYTRRTRAHGRTTELRNPPCRSTTITHTRGTTRRYRGPAKRKRRNSRRFYSFRPARKVDYILRHRCVSSQLEENEGKKDEE